MVCGDTSTTWGKDKFYSAMLAECRTREDKKQQYSYLEEQALAPLATNGQTFNPNKRWNTKVEKSRKNRIKRSLQLSHI